MSTNAPTRRPSSLRMAAVVDVLGGMGARLTTRWAARVASGQLEVSRELLDTLVREASLEARAAVGEMHERARLIGRAQVRAELGLPPEGLAPTPDPAPTPR